MHFLRRICYSSVFLIPVIPRGHNRELTRDKKSIKVNDSLTLAGIPPEVFE